jgi:hypothetical protein
MGRRRRDAPSHWQLEGTPTGRTENVTGARRRERRPRRSQRVGGVDVAGLAWVVARRRCSRRRSILCSSPAPLRSRTAPPPRPAPRELVTPRRRRAGGGAAHQPSPLLLPFSTFPPFCFPFGGGSGSGQNPNVGWWRLSSGACLPPAFEPAAPQGRGGIPRAAPRLGPPGARGGGACPLSALSGLRHEIRRENKNTVHN